MNALPVFVSLLLLATTQAQYDECSPELSPICGSCSDCEFPTSTIVTVQYNYKDFIHVGVICGNDNVTFEWRELSLGTKDGILVSSLGYECTDPDGNSTSGSLLGTGSPLGPDLTSSTIEALPPNTTCAVTGCYYNDFWEEYSFPSINCTVLSELPSPSPSSSPIPETSSMLQTPTATQTLHVEQTGSLPSPSSSSVTAPSPSSPSEITESRGQIPITVIAVVISTAGVLAVLVLLLICCLLSLRRKSKDWYGDLYKDYDTEKIDLNFCPVDINAKMTPAESLYSIYYGLDWDYVRARNATFDIKPTAEDDDEASAILLSGSESQSFDTRSCKSVLMAAENSANEAPKTTCTVQTITAIPAGTQFGYVQEGSQGNANIATSSNRPASTFDVSNEIQVPALSKSSQMLPQNGTTSGYVRETSDHQPSIAVPHSHGNNPVNIASVHATGSVAQSGYVQEGDSNTATVSVEFVNFALAYDRNGLGNELQANAQCASQVLMQKSARSGYLPDPSSDQLSTAVPALSHSHDVPANAAAAPAASTESGYVRDQSDVMDAFTHYQEAAADQLDLYDMQEFEPIDRNQSLVPITNNGYTTETDDSLGTYTITASTDKSFTSEYVSADPTSVLEQATPSNPAITGVLEDIHSTQTPHFATTRASSYLQSERANVECLTQTPNNSSNMAAEREFNMADILCSEESWESTSEPQSIAQADSREALTDYISRPSLREEPVSMGQYLAVDTTVTVSDCYHSETVQEAIDFSLHSEASLFTYSPTTPSLYSSITGTSHTADETPYITAAENGYVVKSDYSTQEQGTEQSLSDATDFLSIASSSDVYMSESDTAFSTSELLYIDSPLLQREEVVTVDSNLASGYVGSAETSGVETSGANLVDYPVHSKEEIPYQPLQQSKNQTSSTTENRTSGNENAARLKKSSSEEHKSPSKLTNSPPSWKRFLPHSLSCDSDYFSGYSSSTPSSPMTPCSELHLKPKRAANAFPLDQICRATESDSASGYTNPCTSAPSSQICNTSNSAVIPSLLSKRNSTASLPSIKEVPIDMAYDSDYAYTEYDLSTAITPTTPDSEVHDRFGSVVLPSQLQKVVDNPISPSATADTPLRMIASFSSSGYLGSISSNESTISSDDVFLAESDMSIQTPGYVSSKASGHGRNSADHINTSAGTVFPSFVNDYELEYSQEDTTAVPSPTDKSTTVAALAPPPHYHYAASPVTAVIPSLMGRHSRVKQIRSGEILENISRQSLDDLTLTEPVPEHHIAKMAENGYVHA